MNIQLSDFTPADAEAVNQVALAALIALHTSRIMEVALAMYQRLGFEFASEAPAIHGVPYGIYIKKLEPKA